MQTDHVLAGLFATALALAPLAGLAQTRQPDVAPPAAPSATSPATAGAPGRIANRWNGKDHEPSAGAVLSNERAAGIAPPAQQQQNQTNEVEQQANRLIDKTQHTTGQSTLGTLPVPPRPVGG